MTYKTLLEIKNEVKRALDIEEEDFIQDDEITDYINEAIDECEAEIHDLNKDYFLTKANISLVAGTASYSLPAGIYASKIRRVMYSVNGRIYPIRRVREEYEFEKIANILQYSTSTEDYGYILQNDSAATGVKMVIYPTPYETSSTAVTIWYYRNANRLSSDSDLCDIPEFYQFVVRYAKMRVYEKEMHPNLEYSIQQVEAQRKQMVDTLTEMSPDTDNTVNGDYSHYWEHS